MSMCLRSTNVRPRLALAMSATVLGLFATCSSVVSAADAVPGKIKESVALEPAAEWFAAEEAGQIEVKFIPKDATEATIVVKNLTDKPLTIKLPEAFAAVPVQAQMGGMGMGGMGGGGMGGMGGGMGGMGGGMGGGGQGMGGGMGGMGGGMGGGGMGGMGGGGMMGGGMMRIAPEKQTKMKVVTVCLEHGKPDPNPKMTYKMIPADKFIKDERVMNLCKMLGHGLTTQNTAQAAAWHLTDGMSWDQLAAKNRVESKYTGNIAFFNPFELRQASLLVSEVSKQDDSKSESNSGSSY